MSAVSTETRSRRPGEIQATIQAIDLKNAINRVMKATSRKATIPVLTGILIKAGPENLSVSATNMDLYLAERFQAEVAAAGEIVVPARPLALLLGLVPKDAPVSLVTDLRTYTMTLAWDRSTYHMHGWSSDQFPSAAEVERHGMVTMEPARLRQMFERVAWTMGHDESKPWLTGMRIRATAERLNLIATQGTCIGRSSTPTAGGLGEGDLIISGNTIREMIQVLKRTREERAALTWGNHVEGETVNVVLQAGDTTVISRTLEGQYPDVERLVPQEYPDAAEMPRLAFIAALKRLMIVSSDGTTRWRIGPGDQVQLEANIPELGMAVERIAGATSALTEEFSIGFNGQFFISVLSTWDCETIRLEFSGSRNPVRVSPVGAEYPYDAVILPLITF